MLILAKAAEGPRPAATPAPSSLQMEQVLGTCLERGIKVVANAGGLNPAGCADAIAALADTARPRPRRLRRRRRPARPASPSSSAAVSRSRNLDTGEPLRRGRVHARDGQRLPGRLGASSRRCDEGADVVITGRVTDAAVVARAGGVVATTGSAPTGTPGRRRRRRPHHRVRRPGHRRQLRLLRRGAPASSAPASRSPRSPRTGRASSPSTPGTGGLVSIGTVTAQLLYEIQGARATSTPTSSLDFDSIALDDDGPDRVLRLRRPRRPGPGHDQGRAQLRSAATATA